MSETEHNIGKLIPMSITETLEETAKRIHIENGWNKPESETFLESLKDLGYRKYIILLDENKIYKVVNKQIDPDDEILHAKTTTNGIIEYELRFYNGGASFDEAMQEALKRHEILHN